MKLTIKEVRQALNSQEAKAVVVQNPETLVKIRVERPYHGWTETRLGRYSDEAGPAAFHFFPKNVIEIVR